MSLVLSNLLESPSLFNNLMLLGSLEPLMPLGTQLTWGCWWSWGIS